MTLPVELHSWAVRHHVSAEALVDLARTLGHPMAPGEAGEEASETRVQSCVRLAAPMKGYTLWRNNVGVLQDARGVPVRFGLANDSPKLNERLKSGDLIGWRRREITPDMVGRVVAQFVSLEVKAGGWAYSGDGRERAQSRWASLVAADGGMGRFITDAEQLP